jgi:ribonuclease HII
MPRNTNQTILKSSYCDDDVYLHSSANNNNLGDDIYYEIGVDEAGRGPMLGRVYASAVVLPKSMEEFDHSLMKDSKKFHSEKKIKEVAEYIKEHAIAWSVQYSDENVIDKINIRNATHKAMHAAITDVTKQLETKNQSVSILLLIDGNDFTPVIYHNSTNSTLSKQLSHVCIEGGDNTYSSIAAASILSKVSRDEYIAELCKSNPNLDEHYGILKNKGYGTKKHMDGIKEHGITPFHRKSFGICRSY